jgi:hypothetical protein
MLKARRCSVLKKHRFYRKQLSLSHFKKATKKGHFETLVQRSVHVNPMSMQPLPTDYCKWCHKKRAELHLLGTA